LNKSPSKNVSDITSGPIYRPIVLIILDGWGLSPAWGGNPLSMSNPKNINRLWREYPHTVLQAFSEFFKSKNNIIKIANSEVGHASLGAGIMVKPDVIDINEAIADGQFFHNKTLKLAANNVKRTRGALHLIGLFSDGGVHSHLDHLFALLDFAKAEGLPNVFIHLITDGTDSGPTEAIVFLKKLEEKIAKIGVGKVASLVGRYFAMDRNENIDRTLLVYKIQIIGEGDYNTSVGKALSEGYAKKYNDENFPATAIVDHNGKPIGPVKDGDSVIFFNFRADRARQLTRAYTDSSYLRQFGIWRKYPLKKIFFATLTDYGLKNKNIKVVFPAAKIPFSLAKILSARNMKQLHLAESEKYAHITYFFNGGWEEPLKGEKRVIFRSSSLEADKYPQMQTPRLTTRLISSIKRKDFDLIVANFPNVDMIGHTGNILAANKAVQTIDECVGKIAQEILKTDGVLIITADHGNGEAMISVQNSDPETLHSLNPVPFILVSRNFRKDLLQSAVAKPSNLLSRILESKHTLAHVAPTILELFGISKPPQMQGHSILKELE